MDPVDAQSTLAWDQSPDDEGIGYIVTIDGVRIDYGLSPVNDSVCGCSIVLDLPEGRHSVAVSAYNETGESPSSELVMGPTATLGGPHRALAGIPLTFSAAGSVDSAIFTTYIWSWGDGTSDLEGNVPDASHTYTDVGIYEAALTVTDADGATHRVTTTVTAEAASLPDPVWVPTGPDVRHIVSEGFENVDPITPDGSVDATAVDTSTIEVLPSVWSNQDIGSPRDPMLDDVAIASDLGDRTSSARDVIIYGSDVALMDLHGGWLRLTDSTSPNRAKLVTTNTGFVTADLPEAWPEHYFEITFDALADTPYRVWLRLKALNNDKYNDSLWVQFSDALVNGVPFYEINSTSALLVNLATDGSSRSLEAWGWQNGAYWLSQPTTVTFAQSGAHTLRIQVREDGVQLDQIVLSPGTYLRSPPGETTNDITIVQKP